MSNNLLSNKNEFVNQVFKTILHNSSDIIFNISSSGTILFISPSFSDSLNYSISKVIGSNILDYMHPEDINYTLKYIDNIKEKEIEDSHLEARIRSADGHFFWHNINMEPIYDELNNLSGYIGIARDVSEFKEAYNALGKKVDELEQFFDLNLDLLAIGDMTGKLVKLNKAWTKTFGYSLKELQETSHIKYIHPDDLTKTLEVFSQINNEQKVLNFTNRFRCKDGSYRYIEWQIQPHKDLVFGIARDITDKILAQEEIEHKHELMGYVIEHTRSSVAVHDKDLRYMYVSKDYLESYKIEGNVIGKHHYQVIPDLPDKWRQVHKRVLNGEVVSAEEDIFVRDDGKTEYTRWECRPWYLPDNSIGGLIVYTEVITEQIKEKERITKEREQFKKTLLSISDGVISINLDNEITLINKAACTLTGYSEKEALGCSLRKICKLEKEINKPTVKDIENVLITKSGDRVNIEISLSPIKDPSDQVNGAIIIIRDISERYQKNKELEYLSNHDYLTGVYNRHFMEKKLLELDTEDNLPLTLVITDVNGLKLINDAYGHDVGDKLLMKVSELIKHQTSKEDYLGRIGSDEFIAFLPKTSLEAGKALIKDLHIKANEAKLDSVIISLACGVATKTDIKQDINVIRREANNNMYRDKQVHGRTMRSQTIETVLRNINNKYDREQVHTERVSVYCERLAQALQLSNQQVVEAKIAGVLHDIGKIMVPAEILNKEEHLTKEEWAEVQRHPVTGYHILKSVDEYAHLADSILYHHERFDGKGYPDGLSGHDIPLLSRIITVTDAYEAMTASRPYQDTKTSEAAIEELRNCKGSQFDPYIVEVFIDEVLK